MPENTRARTVHPIVNRATLPLATPLRHLAAALLACAMLASHAADSEPPPHLRDTGLGARGVMPFSPQYTLWSDGADKRRWLWLPPGRSIDASNPDAWQFPPGTRLWKEFAVDGKPVETRYIERRASGRWAYATYVWNADGSDATLAPARGASALGGRYSVPSRDDCQACHGSAAVPVLGVGALQLSPERDPLAAHGQLPRAGDVDLHTLVRRGLVRGLPPALLATPPRIAADTPVERAALGYLHANCGHCHNGSDNRVPLRLTLAQSVAAPVASRDAALASLLGAPSRYRPPGLGGAPQVVSPGQPDSSVLTLRMQSRHPQVQMPPLGTQVPDTEGSALVHRWIQHDLAPQPPRKEASP